MRPAERAAVEHRNLLPALAQPGRGHRARVGAGKAAGHCDVKDGIARILLVQLQDIPRGGLAARGQVLCINQPEQLLRRELVEFPVGFAPDGDGQRRDGEPRLPRLCGGIQRGGIGKNADHKENPFPIWHNIMFKIV